MIPSYRELNTMCGHSKEFFDQSYHLVNTTIIFFLYMDLPKGKNFERNMSFKEVLRSIALKIIME